MFFLNILSDCRVTYLVTLLAECNPQHLRVVPVVVHMAVVSQNKEGRQVPMAGKDTLVPRRDMEYTQETQEHSVHSAEGMGSL